MDAETHGAVLSERGDDEQAETADPEEDFRELKDFTLVRHHNKCRHNMFSPLEAVADLPLPLSKIDVMRKTQTDLENDDEILIEDCWDGTPSDQIPLSAVWTGKTTFTRIREWLRVCQ